MEAALVAACEAGDVAAVVQLLAAGADANADGAKPLLLASSNGSLRIVELLLDAGADARAGESRAVLYACNGGHLGIGARLRQAGAHVRGRIMKEALCGAVRRSRTNVLEYLIADGTATAADLDSALLEAITRPSNAAHDIVPDMCDLLLAAGANVHSSECAAENGADALEAAARTGPVALVEWLLERCSNAAAAAAAPPAERQKSLDRALITASAEGHADVVALLLASGADVHASNDTALICASVEGHAAVLSCLLDAGADVHAEEDLALRDAGQGTASGRPDAAAVRTIPALLAAGANVHAKDDEALAHAARYGFGDVVALLLDAGADVRSRKYRALRWAMMESESDLGNRDGQQTVLALLLAAGAATWQPQPGGDNEGGDAENQARFFDFCSDVVALEKRLEAASARGDVAAMDALLAMPPSISLEMHVDLTLALSNACRHGHDAVVARLIASGAADVNYGAIKSLGGVPAYVGPLPEACESGHVAVVQRLVEAGADINMLQGAPLTLAAQAGRVDVISCLLAHGAHEAAFLDKALCAAATFGKTLAVARLLAAGPTLRARQSAVHAAVNASRYIDRASRIAVVRQLVDAGVDLSSSSDETLALAVGDIGSLTLVKLLLRAGANVHAQDDRALVVACGSSHARVAIVECLLDAGADVAHVDWTRFSRQDRVRLVLRVRPGAAEALPRWIRLVRSFHRVGVRRALQRARHRLDQPPTSTLGTNTPTREQLIVHLQSAGRRFAREYWTEGLPLFFSDLELGPVPTEFLT